MTAKGRLRSKSLGRKRDIFRGILTRPSLGARRECLRPEMSKVPCLYASPLAGRYRKDIAPGKLGYERFGIMLI
jgi:hypothetical protein